MSKIFNIVVKSEENINDTLLYLDTSSIENEEVIELLALMCITAIGKVGSDSINLQTASFWFFQSQLNNTLRLIAIAVDLNLIVKIQDSRQYTIEEILKNNEDYYNLFNSLPRLTKEEYFNILQNTTIE